MGHKKQPKQINSGLNFNALPLEACELAGTSPTFALCKRSLNFSCLGIAQSTCQMPVNQPKTNGREAGGAECLQDSATYLHIECTQKLIAERPLLKH